MLFALSLPAFSQSIKSDYVDWGPKSTDFSSAFSSWKKGQKWTDDDNFFISRVKPHLRFRNTATQVNPELTDENDKNLLFWVPINKIESNALPDGVFDSEIFPMWAYITHYGNWTAPFVRVPGNFIDAAHKNGVGVSCLASVPYGNISSAWKNTLTKMTESGPEKMADFLATYGIDGIGYNSEFNASVSLVSGLCDFHAQLTKLMKKDGRMPLAMNVWYDGTNESARITFDKGLGTHNDDIWGYGDDIKTSLFLNYNWNRTGILYNTVKYANTLGRTPLDIYAGINMQGREPKTGNIWSHLAKYPVSIGLWGAHSQNMFFESRAEKGASPENRQKSYLQRVERWFTGGKRNPILCGAPDNSLIFGAENEDFAGMSTMMSARSALKWNLSDEPFISNFNLGNGRFFNFKGKRKNSLEWYNIGIQDYMPTWMWWFSSRFLGREKTDAPSGSLDARFTWDDAWLGGSCLRIHGSSGSKTYLHLFKTEFGLRNGDVITVRYKINGGKGDATLALSMKGDEASAIESESLRITTGNEIPGSWNERRFTVGSEIAADGKELAMIALRFDSATDLDMLLGEVSVVRGDATSAKPSAPVIESASVLEANRLGADAKIIWNMPNGISDRVCYNIDVKTSYYKLYARQDGHQPVLMGMTPSWAGLMFSIPVDYSVESPKVRLGVSAMSLDMTCESDIAWSEPLDVISKYGISDDIMLSHDVIIPGQAFEAYYADPLHQNADWELSDNEGNVVAESHGTLSLNMDEGLQKPGIYTLRVKGTENPADGTACETTREFPGFVQVSDASHGSIPSVNSLTSNGKEDYIEVSSGDTVTLEYSGEATDGKVSRGIRVGEHGVGFKLSEAGHTPGSSFSIGFWFKPETFADQASHLLNLRDRGAAWAVNHWGWMWTTIGPDGRFNEFTIRTGSDKNISYKFDNTRFEPGAWYHIVFSFDFNSSGGVLGSLFVNGRKQELTSWSIGDTKLDPSTVKHSGTLYGYPGGTMASVGGFLHNSGSVIGNIDNFSYWNKALDEEGAKTAMGDIDPANLPDGLEGWFDFEGGCDADGRFDNLGKGSFRLGTHDFIPTEIEGQGTVKWEQPAFCPGSPYVKGDAQEIKTSVNWNVQPALLISSEGDRHSGSASVKIPDYPTVVNATLSLSNAYGTDSRNLILSVDGAGEVDGIHDEPTSIEVGPNPFSSHFTVSIPEPGKWDVELFDMAGFLTGKWTIGADAPRSLTIAPAVGKGCYILKASNGKDSHTARIIKR